MLHLIESTEGFAKCKNLLSPQDTVVFLGESVLSQEALEGCDSYVHEADLARYGMATSKGVKSCTMADIVRLAAEHTNSATWR